MIFSGLFSAGKKTPAATDAGSIPDRLLRQTPDRSRAACCDRRRIDPGPTAATVDGSIPARAYPRTGRSERPRRAVGGPDSDIDCCAALSVRRRTEFVAKPATARDGAVLPYAFVEPYRGALHHR